MKSCRHIGLSALMVLLAACAGKKEKDGAEPVEPPSYGEEIANPEVFFDTMEVGSRELYAAREAVLAAARVAPGARIADVGAGTGLYSLLFAEAVGAKGVIYAVDIEPRFLKLIGQRAADLDVGNIVTVLGRDSDITLPPASVDLIFIADTYHYFSDRRAIMSSARDALVPGGRLIILDYNLTPDSATDQKRAHVRFGKAGLIDEVRSFGFELAEEPSVPGLSDFYMTVFSRTADTPNP